MDAVFAINRAAGWDDLRAAASLFEVPAQNIVYADTAGHIGYQAPGRVPVRKGYDGRWPAQGWTGKQEWTGFADFDDLPRVLDPDDGFIVTANNAVVPADYPVFLTDDWDAGYRAARIRSRLEALVARGGVTAEDLMAVQRDTRNNLAPALLPALLRTEVPQRIRPGVDLLRHWDGRQGPDSAGCGLLQRGVATPAGADLPRRAAEVAVAGRRRPLVPGRHRAAGHAGQPVVGRHRHSPAGDPRPGPVHGDAGRLRRPRATGWATTPPTGGGASCTRCRWSPRRSGSPGSRRSSGWSTTARSTSAAASRRSTRPAGRPTRATRRTGCRRCGWWSTSRTWTPPAGST